MSVPRGKVPQTAMSVELEVPFHDVDPLHIVWHGHYFKYFEIARTKLFRAHDIDGKELLDLGYHFVVTKSEARHIQPLRYGEKFRASAWFIETEHRLNIGYDIFNLSREEKSARARTELVTVDRNGNLLFETPELILNRIKAGPSASEAS